jgi:glycosyltransferase involved in cell wall biosynthesis
MSETATTHQSGISRGATAVAPSEVPLSIVLPARNEAQSLKTLIPRLRMQYPGAEIIVVNDGSTDNSARVAADGGATVVTHPYPKGNGAAIKSGARAATGDVIVFMDADSQHAPEDVGRLVAKLDEGYEMAVGARDSGSQASFGRRIANDFYRRFASWMVKHDVKDLTSGFRAVKAARFREFLHLLPNGFSYPTTSTMAFFRTGYSVAYVPIKANRRLGDSHIRPIRDGLKFVLIMFRICTLFSPLRLFGPISFGFFSIASAYYAYSYFTLGRFTNMSALLYSTSIIIFLIGLISEQITMLIYKRD